MQELKWSHQQHPRDLNAMVDAQVRHWIFQQKGRQPLLEEWPVVTIASELDAQGMAVGRGIAERLGFSYCDREVLSELAHRMYVSNGAGGVFDARTRNVLEDLLNAFAPNLDVTSAGFAKQVSRIVASITRQGSAVIVAKEASFLVAPGRALRVRLVAPLESRIRELETRSQVSLAAAQRMIASNEKERAASIRHALGQDIADPAHYDVVVNTGTYSLKRAEAVVLMAYLAKFGEWPLSAHGLKGEATPASVGMLPGFELDPIRVF